MAEPSKPKLTDPQKRFLQTFIEHLTFHGYSCELDEAGLNARHPTKPFFRVYFLRDGLIFLAPFTVGAAVAQDMSGFLEFVNRLNAGTGMCKYYYAVNSLFVQGCYVGDYERERFSFFFDAFLAGIASPSAVFPSDMAKYFSAVG
jgi:hypothetical protein